jgi:hypothetical protein
LAGVLAASPELLASARARLEARLGPVASASEPYRFGHTAYYTEEMGADLLRQFLVFRGLRPAEELADWKRDSNALEQVLGGNSHGGRQVNIDPGYLAPGKLVLASTKDHMHRIYLRDGIFAEVTLRVHKGRFVTWDWSYPDYAAAIPFFDQAYQEYLQAVQSPDRG